MKFWYGMIPARVATPGHSAVNKLSVSIAMWGKSHYP